MEITADTVEITADTAVSGDLASQFVTINETVVNFDFDPPVDLESQNIDEDNIGDCSTTECEYADEEEIPILPESVAEAVRDITEICKENVQQQENFSDVPLYDGCTKNIGFVLLIICSLSIRFKFSDEALSHIISLIGLILPPGHVMIKSVYALKDYLKRFVCFPTIHYLCTWCGTHVSKGDKTCKNDHCQKDLSQSGAIGYFIQHSIIEQLRLMSKRESFLHKIRTHRFAHYEKNVDANISDIYDGSNYKTAFEKGFLSDPHAVSFSMNTDGVQIFKSSTVSMWPVYLTINELPTTDRKLKENVIYYGLYIASKKPQMWSYLKPLYQELKQLEEGVKVDDKAGNSFTMKATILNCVCDLPARCMVSNSMQFNGFYGCWFCHQPGETYKTNKGGNVHIYPFKDEDPKGPPRTVENLQEDVNQVVENVQANVTDYVVRGVKGPFWFMFLPHFNVIHGFVIDYMHGVCAGVMKMMLTLWFDKQHKNEAYSILDHKTTVSDRLSAINPNIQITRPPRSLNELSHWKTAEYRNFLFLWSLPVLHDILPEEYFLHFSLLVRGIFTLARENISMSELRNAEQCLTGFVENFASLYTQRYMLMNIHQLLHITDCVTANGPLFANNCFAFEDFNGYLLKNIHGPTGVEMQVINAITKMQAIPTLQEQYVEKNSLDEVFVNKIVRPNYLGEDLCIEAGIYVLGYTCPKRLDPDEFVAISALGIGFSADVVEYKKVFLTKLSSAVYATSYERKMKRNQSTIKYADPMASGSIKFATVKSFVQVGNTCTDGSINVALINPLPFGDGVSYSPQKPCHRVSVSDTGTVAIQISSILKVCNLLNMSGTVHVSEFPNKYEKD
jgi:hypothetical protein